VYVLALLPLESVTLKYKLFYFKSNKGMSLDFTVSSHPYPPDCVLYIKHNFVMVLVCDTALM
jgi:hypothetical protein